MSKRIDITGNKYNMLTVIGVDKQINGIVYWWCKCDCGKITSVRGANLKNGCVKSCGCLRYKTRNTTHGLSNTKEYAIWISMKNRCYNKNVPSYKDYGGRGIEVCEEWKNSFMNFYEWILQTRHSEDETIDRIDNDGNYEPSNCRWTTIDVQQNNRRICHYFTMNGKTQTLAMWCKELNLDYKRVHNRLFKLKWSFEDAISVPVNKSKRNMDTRRRKGRD